MILHVYSVMDLKGVAFATPFFQHTDGLAVRAFSDAVQDPNHAMSRHLEDYVLYRIGDFDDQTGLLSPLKAPVEIANGYIGAPTNG